MAAVDRGGHARQGGRGRGHAGGRRGGGAAAAAAEPAQQGRVNPPGYQWLLWRAGNTNSISTSKSKDEDESVRIYRELDDSTRVNRQELNRYGIPDGILGQRHEIMRIIQAMVAKYNVMADMRQRYLFKSLHGYQGKEMSQILKRLQTYQEDVVSQRDDIIKEQGYCPPTPAILLTTPKLL